MVSMTILATWKARRARGERGLFVRCLEVWFVWTVRAAFAGAVVVALLALLRRPIRAEVDRTLMSVGSQMMRYTGALQQQEPRTVVLNGQRLKMSAGGTDRSVGDVLDFFEARCGSGPASDMEDAAAALTRGEPAGEPAPELLGTLRGGGEAGGFVACVGGADDASSLGERAERLIASGDVSALGVMRYVYAERRGERTSFLAIWTEGQFRLFDMMPGSGDAPGDDAPVAGRPPDAERLMSMHEEGQPYSTTIYASSRPLDDLALHYREHLAGIGWKLVNVGAAGERARPGEQAVYAMKDGAFVGVMLTAAGQDADRTGGGDGGGGQTVVTVLTAAALPVVR
jgi:hypothetical protein